MNRLKHLSHLHWDDIGQALLQTAARHLADAAQKRAGVSDAKITLGQPAPDRLRLSISTPDLIRREQGDSRTSPHPFLAPTAQDRSVIREAMREQIRKIIA